MIEASLLVYPVPAWLSKIAEGATKVEILDIIKFKEGYKLIVDILGKYDYRIIEDKEMYIIDSIDIKAGYKRLLIRVKSPLFKLLDDVNKVEIKTNNKDELKVTVVLSDLKELKELIRRFNSNNFRIKVLSISKFPSMNLLTPKQENIIINAYKLGYFDYPKRITLKELAKKVEMSPSATLETLRRAEKKIIKWFLNY
jgi:hypothetical protein